MVMAPVGPQPGQHAASQRHCCSTTTTGSPIFISSLGPLDAAAQAIGWALSKVSPVTGAGAFWISGGQSFVDCWREPGAWTLRLGRLELVADLKA